MRRKESRRRRSSTAGLHGSERGGRQSKQQQHHHEERQNEDDGTYHPDIVNRHFAELYNVDSVQIAATARVELFLPSLHEQSCRDIEARDGTLPMLPIYPNAMISFRRQQQIEVRRQERERERILAEQAADARRRGAGGGGARSKRAQQRIHAAKSGDGAASHEHPSCTSTTSSNGVQKSVLLMRRRQRQQQHQQQQQLQQQQQFRSRLGQHQHRYQHEQQQEQHDQTQHQNTLPRAGRNAAADTSTNESAAVLVGKLRGGISGVGRPLRGRVVGSSGSRTGTTNTRLNNGGTAGGGGMSGGGGGGSVSHDATSTASENTAMQRRTLRQTQSMASAPASNTNMIATIGAMPATLPPRRSKHVRYVESTAIKHESTEKLSSPLKQLMAAGGDVLPRPPSSEAMRQERTLPLPPRLAPLSLVTPPPPGLEPKYVSWS